MKRILCLVAMFLFVAVSAFADSGSMVDGSFIQQSGAIVTPSFTNPNLSGNAGASGNQNGGGSFYANPSNPAGESAQGGGLSTSAVVVDATVVHVDGTSITSTASGNVSNNGAVNVSEVGGTTAKLSLYGNGSLVTGANAVIGADVNGNITNGAFASGNTNGSFNYNVSGGAGSWIGNGSTDGISTTSVTKNANGFTSTSSATVNSTSCPK